MVKVYASKAGAVIRVDSYGVATDASPVMVPAEVAKELIKMPEFRGERESPAPAPDTKPAKGEKE